MTSVRDASSLYPNGSVPDNTYKAKYLRSMDAGEPSWYFEPILWIAHQHYFQEHRPALWNPYQAYGAPLAATMHSQPFYPLTALMAIYPSAKIYDWFIVLRLWIAGFFAYLFARYFLKKIPSLFCGITFMLSGYFIIFMNMPEISIAILTPALLCTIENLLRCETRKGIALSALVIFLVFAGGVPESTFIVLCFAYIYFIFRCLSQDREGAVLWKDVMNFTAANILGFMLAAVLLLPFIELLQKSFNVHQPSNIGGLKTGLFASQQIADILSYVIPTIFSSNLSSGFTINYFGVIPWVFAGFSVIFLFYSFHHKRITLFFLVILLLGLLKQYGNILVNWIGALPFAEMVGFPKHQAPVLSLCVAMLGAIGFEAILEGKKINWKIWCLPFIATGAVIGVGFIMVVYVFPRHFIWNSSEELLKGYPALWLPFIFLILILGIILAGRRMQFRKWAPVCTIILLAAELYFIFIYPSFYLMNPLPPKSAAPYLGAPYVRFLEPILTNQERIFAKEGVLVPDWAGVFGFQDIRNQEAIYFNKYRTFIRSFLLKPGDENRIADDLADRFTGFYYPYVYDFHSPGRKKFLEISSVKYLLCVSSFGGTWIDAILEQQKKMDLNFNISKRMFNIEGHKEAVFFQHPPSSRIPFTFRVDPDAPKLRFSIALQPEVYGKSKGVEFILEIKEGDRIHPLFKKFLDPSSRHSDQGWQDVTLDISRYAGRTITLLFTTWTGATGTNAYDWAGWGKFDMPGRQMKAAMESAYFHKIYDKDIKIYEISHSLPRASVFYGAEVIQGEKKILQRLKDASFDPWRRVVVDQDYLKPDDMTLLNAMGNKSESRAEAAQIVSSQSEDVKIQVHPQKNGLLMLTDTDYPGWKVYVDGKLSRIINVNYLFRGVLLTAGPHEVEFYYMPLSFKLGAGISLTGLVVLIGLVFYPARRVRKE